MKFNLILNRSNWQKVSRLMNIRVNNNNVFHLPSSLLFMDLIFKTRLWWFSLYLSSTDLVLSLIICNWFKIEPLSEEWWWGCALLLFSFGDLIMLLLTIINQILLLGDVPLGDFISLDFKLFFPIFFVTSLRNKKFFFVELCLRLPILFRLVVLDFVEETPFGDIIWFFFSRLIITCLFPAAIMSMIKIIYS